MKLVRLAVDVQVCDSCRHRQKAFESHVLQVHGPRLMHKAVSLTLETTDRVAGQQGPYRDGNSGEGQVGGHVPDSVHGGWRKDLLELRLGERLQRRQ